MAGERDEGASPGFRDSADDLASKRVASRAAGFSLVARGAREGSFWLWRMRREHRPAFSFAAAAIAWVPLVLLVAIGHRNAMGLFLRDYAVHVRAWFALPMLLLVEPLVDRRVRSAARHLLDCHLVKTSQLSRYERALARIEGLRDSRWVPVVIVALAAVISVYSATRSIGMPNLVWSTYGDTPPRTLTLAGWWYLIVSLPMSQVLLILWLWRWILWTVFLWNVSRLDLRLMATHVDRVAGLGFLAVASASFSFVWLGPSTFLSATWISAMLNQHVPISRFASTAAAQAASVIVLVFAPLTMFGQRLRRVQREHADRYGVLVHRYLRRFDRMWTGPAAPADDAALEDLDAQNVADVGNVFDAILRMRFIPFEPRVVPDLVVGAVLPVLPMIVASAPPTEIVRKVLQALL